MLRLVSPRLVAGLAVLLSVVGAQAQSGNRVFDRTVDIVRENFYHRADLSTFNAAVAAVIARMPDLAAAAAGSDTTREAVDAVLASLGASHTGRFVQDDLDYYELADVFRFALRRDMRRAFPPEGEVRYDGIGIATAVVGRRVFVTDVYDGGPAAGAGIMPGDEILTVDGEAFTELGSFKGKVGRLAEVSLRRTADGEPFSVEVRVARLQPTESYLTAIRESARVVVEHDGYRIGVVRLWSYTAGDQVTRVLYDEIADGALADADGLVLDLRSRWGGAPADAAETFVGGTADMRLVDRDGDENYANERWRRPLVAIIDEGTRSGMELLAYSLKKNGVPLIGAETAGDVLAATAYLLPDNSLLVLAVQDVFVDDDVRLEGNPVQPDVAVSFDVRYAAGSDPQLDAALAVLTNQLSGAAD